MGKKQKIDHSGKHIFVGIDVHKKTYTITAMAEHIAYPVKVGGMAADPEAFIEWLKNRFPDAILHTAYEAGFSGFHLHRKMKAAGIDNIVVNPGSIEVAVSNNVKTDKRDSYKIAEHLLQKRIKGIHIPSKAQEEARQITRTRTQLVKKRTGIGNQIKAKLFLFGFIKHNENKKMSPSFIKKVLPTLDLGYDLKYSIDCLARIYLCINDQVKEIDKRIAAQAAKDHTTDAIYRSVPGIGPVWARTLANELGDLTYFTSEKKLFSYLGLTPTESSSGEKRIQGHISRQGKSILRMVLCEASWVAIKKDPALAKSFERIKFRRGAKRAIIAICRKLIGRIRHCLINQKHYLLGHGLKNFKPVYKYELKTISSQEAARA